MVMAAFAMACQVLYYRSSFEAEAKGVEIALEYGDLLKIAAMSDREPLELLEEAHLHGLTTLVLLDEQALDPDPGLFDFIKELGMLSALQMSNKEEYLQGNVIDHLAQGLYAPNLSLIFFAGYEALGWPDQIDSVAGGLNYIGLPPGWVEMLGEQKGLDTIMEEVNYRMIRIHPGYAYETLDDMVRSVTERGIRFLFLKPFKNMGLIDPEPALMNASMNASMNAAANTSLSLQAAPQIDEATGSDAVAADQVLLQWVSEMATKVTVAGYPLQQSKALNPISITPQAIAYICIGIAIGVLAVLQIFIEKTRFYRPAMIAAAVTMIVVLLLSLMELLDPLLIREGFALLAAIAFPSLGVLRAWRRLSDDGERRTENGAETAAELPAWRPGLTTLLESSLMTLCGACMANALLSHLIYMTAWRPFRGVKLALLAPLLVLILYLVWTQLRRGSLVSGLRALSPLRIVLSLIAFAAVGFYLLRSGNEVSSISALEQGLRFNLESFFGVRPRFKEFMLGHPATMLLGLSFCKRWPELRLGLLLLTATAQASMFNTFMHVHTPFLISVQRTFWGLALGEVIGLIALALLLLLSKRFLDRPAASARQ